MKTLYLIIKFSVVLIFLLIAAIVFPLAFIQKGLGDMIEKLSCLNK